MPRAAQQHARRTRDMARRLFFAAAKTASSVGSSATARKSRSPRPPEASGRARKSSRRSMRRRERIAVSSAARDGMPRPCAVSRSSVARGAAPMKRSAFSPRRRRLRISEAERVLPSPAPSCALPRRRIASGRISRFSAEIALRYSTARMLFGVSSARAPSPHSFSSTRLRAAAKDSSGSSAIFARIASTVSGSSRRRARASRIPMSSLSVPKLSVVAPSAPSSPTAPRAKLSAEASAQGRGSSNTTSAPPRTAASARACLA